MAENRITTSNWDLYDTRHTVFAPKRLSPKELEEGYWHAYKEFYRWKNIIRSSQTHSEFSSQIRHIAYTAGWKKFEPMWDWGIDQKSRKLITSPGNCTCGVQFIFFKEHTQ
jgi:hypothetical protein